MKSSNNINASFVKKINQECRGDKIGLPSKFTLSHKNAGSPTCFHEPFECALCDNPKYPPQRNLAKTPRTPLLHFQLLFMYDSITRDPAMGITITD
jgi:hypothetical protein